MDSNAIYNIVEQYSLNGQIKSVLPCGNGRINTTFLVSLDNGEKFIVQQINNNVFQDVDGLMKNIELVTEHLKKSSHGKQTLQLIKTRDNNNYVNFGGNFFRMYNYINNSVCYETTDDLKILEECGRAFGQFQTGLKDFDARLLVDSLPNFHNTKIRYRDFLISVQKDDARRVKNVENFVTALRTRRDYAGLIVDKIESGDLSLRVTHNDPKISNAVFDKDSGNCLAVLDLDTVMRGAVAYDFGDAVRCACNTSSEEERDVSKIGLDMQKFDALTKGFVGEVAGSLTKNEIDSLVDGCLCVTYELTLRFLKDYLDGDKYFKVSRENSDENFVRARAQFVLLNDMENKRDKMKEVVCKYAGIQSEKD